MNYMKKVIKVIEKATAKKPGVYHVNIYHDDWCACYRGGECNCNPDVVLADPKKLGGVNED